MSAGYDCEFFASHRDGAHRSAREIVPLVMELVHPESVIDIGCGYGTWLAVFASHGVGDLLGVDGDYIERALLEMPQDRFLASDLRRPLRLDRRFDLAVCLEVAEHLPESCAGTLVDSLAGLSSTILFSCAIPRQGGTGHVNEQWPDYWTERFRSQGFLAADPIRPRIWKNQRVEPWYAQNMLLLVHEEHARANPALAAAVAATDPDRLSIVHPDLYARVADKGARDRESALRYFAESKRLRTALDEERQTARSWEREYASLRREASEHRRKAEHFMAEVEELKSEVRKHRETAEYYFAETERLRIESGQVSSRREGSP